MTEMTSHPAPPEPPSQPLTPHPGEVLVNPLPVTPEQVQNLLAKELKLGLAPALRFYALRVSTFEGTSLITFDTAASFVENARVWLKESAGLPMKLFFFLGWKIEHMAPHVVVGLQLPGRKPEAVVLQQGGPNASGDAPQIHLPAP